MWSIKVEPKLDEANIVVLVVIAGVEIVVIVSRCGDSTCCLSDYV